MVIKEISLEQVLPVRQRVMYPEKSLEELTLDQDTKGLHIGLFKENQLISVVSVFTEDTELQFRKFATLHEYQGKGYGKQLLQYIINYSISHGINRIWCNARKNAMGFYQQFGFSETEKTFRKDGYDFVIAELFLPAPIKLLTHFT